MKISVKEKPEVTAYPLICAACHQGLSFGSSVHQAPQIKRRFVQLETYMDATGEVQQSLRYNTSVHVRIGAAHPGEEFV